MIICKFFGVFRKTPKRLKNHRDSGRSHSHVNTTAMLPSASARAHQGTGTSHSKAALMAMASVACHLERRLTRPPCAQSRSMGPNQRCCHSQWCRRGELRAAAALASKINTVLGSPGTTRPTTPSARHSTAAAAYAQRASGESARRGGAAGEEVGGMAPLCGVCAALSCKRRSFCE